MQHAKPSMYLTLAIADLVYLLAFGIPSITDRAVYLWTERIKLLFQPHNISHLTCKLMAYSIHVRAFVSYWSLIAYAIERLIAIWNLPESSIHQFTECDEGLRFRNYIRFISIFTNSLC